MYVGGGGIWKVDTCGKLKIKPFLLLVVEETRL